MMGDLRHDSLDSRYWGSCPGRCCGPAAVHVLVVPDSGAPVRGIGTPAEVAWLGHVVITLYRNALEPEPEADALKGADATLRRVRNR